MSTFEHAPSEMRVLLMLAEIVLRVRAILQRTAGGDVRSDNRLTFADVTLDPDTLTAIDAIFPGPGGTAPEAYAW